MADETITLETHIRDVAGCIEAEEISDIILVGHSYGGMVITGVADRMADRIKALVYLDAFVPSDGDSLMALLHKAVEPPVAAQFIGSFRGAALETNSGMMHPLTAEMLDDVPSWCSGIFLREISERTGVPPVGQDVEKLCSGHDVMVDLPNELAAAIANVGEINDLAA
jgi:pimeloyl-ACP methyl ester carboxylesterase